MHKADIFRYLVIDQMLLLIMFYRIKNNCSLLVIGMLAYVGYNFLNSQIAKVTNKMEASAAEFMDILQEPTR